MTTISLSSGGTAAAVTLAVMGIAIFALDQTGLPDKWHARLTRRIVRLLDAVPWPRLPQAHGRHQLRPAAATPVRSAPEEGTSPFPAGEVPPTYYPRRDGHITVTPGGGLHITCAEPPTLADADWGDLHALLRDGEPVEPLPPTRIPMDIAAHFARREAGQV